MKMKAVPNNPASAARRKRNHMKRVRTHFLGAMAMCLCSLAALPDTLSAIPAPDGTVPQQPQEDPGRAIVTAARGQIGKTLHYDPAYTRLEYPGGDVPIDRGVCTDVVVRALREAFGMDLQKQVHEDMRLAFSEYPPLWGLHKPDHNIDHRRVPNLQKFFERKGYALSSKPGQADFLPGDVVSCMLPANLPHIMIVSDRKNPEGAPMVIHNIGRGVCEEDRLFEFPLTGHYRIKPPESSE